MYLYGVDFADSPLITSGTHRVQQVAPNRALGPLQTYFPDSSESKIVIHTRIFRQRTE